MLLVFPYKGHKHYMDVLYIGLQQLNFTGTKGILLENVTSNLLSYRKVFFFEKHGGKITLESHLRQIF